MPLEQKPRTRAEEAGYNSTKSSNPSAQRIGTSQYVTNLWKKPGQSSTSSAPAAKPQMRSMSAETYKKYDKEYKKWQKTGKYSDDFRNWMDDGSLELYKNIKSGQGKSALKDGKYYYLDNDTYDKYGKEYANWTQTQQYSSDFGSWQKRDELDAFRAIRGSRSQQDNAFDDFRYSLNDDILDMVRQKYRDKYFGDKNYYDYTGGEIYAQAAGEMPEYLKGKYNQNDPYDRWLYENGLPYSSVFNDLYSESVNDYNENLQKEALKAAAEDEKRQSTYTAAYNSVADYMNGMKGFAEGLEAGQSVEDLLATGKYDAILGYYNSKKPEKEYANEFEKYAAQASKKNPIYDKAYDAIINGKVPDQEFFDTYKEKDWQQYLKDKLSFSDEDLEMSKVIGTVNSAKEKYGMADKIDLLSRVPVSKRDLENAGWETDKKYTTLNTQIESSIDDEGNAKYTVFTTIDPDGKILTKKEYDKYIKEYWKTGADPRNLVLGSFDDKDQAGVYADRLDKHQTKAYQLDAENYEELRDKARQDWLKTIEDPAERIRYEQSFVSEEIQDNNAQIKELEKERKRLSRHAQVDEHGFPVESEESLALLSQINALKERNNQLYEDRSAGSRELEREEMKTADLDQLEAEVEAVYAGYNAKTDRIAEIESEIAGLNAEAMEAKGSGEDVGPYLDRIQELNAEAEQLRGEVADEAKTLDDSGETQRYQRAKAYQLVQSELDKNIRSVEAVDIRGMEGLSVDAQELYWEFVNKLNPEAYDEYTTGIGIVVKNNGAYENEHTMSVDAMEKVSYASDDEMQTALGLMQTDPARAAEYLESLNLLLSMRANENREDEIAKFAREAPGLASALSVPANIIGGFEGMGVLTGTTQADVARFNAPALMFSSTVRGTVSEQIQESNQHVIAGTNITWGDVGSFLYGTGMSMIDSAARAAIATATGGASSAASWASLAIMGSGVAGQTILDSMDKGATTGQALWLGTVAGSIEILTEKVSLTNFFELTASASGRELLANTLKQMMSEAKEEMIAEVVNSIAQLTSGWDEADFIKQVQEYMETHEGVSEAWAITAVLGINTGEAGLGGALSGMGFGAVGAVRETNQYSGKTFRDKMRTVGVYREVNAIDTPTYLQMVADIRATNMDQEYKDAIINLLDEIRMNPQIAGMQSVQDQLRRVQADLRDQNLVDVRFNNIMDEKTANANKAVRKSMMAITAGQQKAQELIAAGDSAGARTVIAKTRELIEAFKEEQESINKRLQNSNIQRQQNTIKANEAAQKLIDETRNTYVEAVGSATIAEQLLQKGIANDSVINEAAERATEIDQGAVGVIPETDEGKGFRADPRNEAVRGVREADANDLRLYGKSQTDLADKLGTDDVGAMTPAKALSQAEVDLANKFYDITGYKLGFFEGNTAAGINDGKSRIGANRNGDIIFTGFHEIYELNLGTETMADAMERLEKLPFFQDMVNRYVEAYNRRITDAYGENAKADPELIKGELIQDMGALFACNRYFDSMYDPAILFIPDGANLTRAEYLDIARNAADMMLEISDILINTAEHGQLSEQYNAQYYKSTPEAATVEEVANSEPVAYEPGEVSTQPSNEDAGFSYVSMIQAAGLNTDTKRDFFGDVVRGNVYREDAAGNRTKVDKVSVEDIRKSPIGAMINESYHAGMLGKVGSPEALANRDYQEKLFSKLLSIMVNTGGTQAEQNFVMAQNFIGSALFTSMKTNSDKQYSFTHDFVSICVKTQAFIDHISAMMVHDGKSLSDTDIIAAYNKVFESNLPVSCPECYVLSRWIGIGSLLDNINRYQERFSKMTPAEVRQAYDETLAEVEAYLKQNPALEGKLGKGKGALADKYSKALAKEQDKLATAIEKGESEKKIQDLRDNIELFSKKYDQIKALAWIKNVYFGGDGNMTVGKERMNTRALVPKEVLFDLNKGDEFATGYQEAWGFRTTQGAGYGKAITPAAESVLGEDILTIGSAGKYIQKKMDTARAGKKVANPFMDMSQMEDDGEGRLRLKEGSDAQKALKSARRKQLIQAFLGGQRWQSTSDARPEFATDYLLSALQDQAMGAMGQSYTKVESAVHALTNWGADPNMSLMPYGNGLDANGVPKDTAVGGMDPKKAQQLRKENERAGTITIGLNDKHIRALYEQDWRDFIIPYHASGGRADMIASMRAIQDRDSSAKTATRSCDYTSTQGDKLLSDSALRWVYTSDSEDAQQYRKQNGITQLTEEEFQAKMQLINDTRNMRKWLMTKGKSGKKVADLIDPNSDRYNYVLDRLNHRLNDKGSIWKEMDGIPVAKFQANDHFQIYPNEFWDQETTYDTSFKNTEDYLYYCESLGVLHRFSGRVPRGVGAGVTALKQVNGYNEKGEKVPMTDLAYKEDGSGIEPFFWKTLTDRRMYGNQGQYLDQQRMTVGTAQDNTDMYDDMLAFANVADTDANGRQTRKYRQGVSMASADEIANMSPEERRAVADKSAAKNIIANMVNGNKKKGPQPIVLRNTVDLSPANTNNNSQDIFDQMAAGYSMVNPVSDSRIRTAVDRINSQKGTEEDRTLIRNLAERAHAVGEKTQAKLNPIMDELIAGNDFFVGKICAAKSVDSIEDKIFRKKRDPLSFGDLARVCFFIRDYNQADFSRAVQYAVDALRSKGLQVTEVDDKFAKPGILGYRGLHIGFEIDGVSCELQFATEELWNEVKLPTDDLYDVIRRENIETLTTEEWQTLNDARERHMAMWEEAVKKYGLPDHIEEIRFSNSSQEIDSSSRGSKSSTGLTHSPLMNSANRTPAEGEEVQAKKLPSSETAIRRSLRTSNMEASPSYIDNNIISNMVGTVNSENEEEPGIGHSLTNFPTGLTAVQRAQMLKASRERVSQQQQNDLAEMIAELHREVKAGRQREEMLEERIRNRDETLTQVRKNRDQKISNMQAEYRDAAAAERAEFNRKLREVKAEDAAKMRQQREAIKSRARRGKLIERIEQNVRDLYQYRTSPDLKKGKYVPDALVNVVDDMMMSIDFGSEKREGGQKVKNWRENMQNLRTALERYQLQRNGDIQGEQYDASLDLPDGFLDLLGQASSMIGDNIHLQDYAADNQEQMDQLELIDTIVSVVKSAVRNVNQLKANNRYATLAEAGKAFLDEVEGRRAKRQSQNRVVQLLDNLVSVDMMDAPSFAQRIGSAGGTFINNIMDGFFKGTQKVRAAQEYMTGAKERAGIDNKTIREWSNEKIEYDTEEGKHLSMSRMQLMELYALSKREQAMRHILGGGIDLARNKASWDSQNQSYKMTYGDLDALFDKLTDQQKDFVDDLQTYLSTEASEWGNEVTRNLYGTSFYNEEFYWPIKSTKTAIEEQAPDSTRMQNAVLNMSASKAINKLANNPIVIDDVLTTFCNHVSQMANYNGLAIPLSDALKFWNYRDRNDDGTVNHNRNTRRAVINMLGQGGASWFSNFMKDVNGLSEGGTGTSIPNFLVSNMKAAAVAGKLRVVIQQPTAIVRAMSMINPKYFAQGSGQSLKATIQEMQDHAPIAWWKSQGNFDIGTGKSIRSIIVGDGTTKEQITNALMTPAGLADDFGWATIWNAAKAETKAYNPGLSDEELLQRTAERFTDVVNKTQVIDTVMHRSQIMRSQDSGVKQSTAFMSEPIKTFNMLYNAAYNAASGAPGGKKQLAKTLGAVIASWVLNAAVLALHDSFRDREEGQKLEDMLADKMLSEFISNANPINSIPYIKDVASIMSGYDSGSMDMSGIGDLIKSGQSVVKAITTGESNYTTYGLISNFAKAGSEVTGLPVAGLLSTTETIWNGIAPGTLPKYQPSSNKALRQQMFDAGLDKENVYDLMVNGMSEVADMTGLSKTTNAVKALAIATADSNNDGVPDFSDSEMDLIADILEIKSYTKKPEKYGSFRQYAIETAQDSVAKGKLEKDVLDYYMELLG